MVRRIPNASSIAWSEPGLARAVSKWHHPGVVIPRGPRRTRALCSRHALLLAPAHFLALFLALSLALTGCGERAGESAETNVPQSAAASGEHRPSGPSIIVITIDTLRRDHLSLYGYERPTSPYLQQLAAESVVFERAISTSPWTKPSTASLFTGLHPSEHGAHGEYKAREDVRFLAEALSDVGYRTAGFSGNPYVSSIYGLDQGFEHFDFQGGAAAKHYVDIRMLVDRARFWLDAGGPGPFFLYLHVMNVHGPYRAPPEYRERFLEEPHEAFPFQNPIWIDIAQRNLVERRADVKPEHLRDLRARYDGAIAYTDEVLGRFIEDLRLRGLLDESVLLITSDHGEELFDHGSFGHRRTLHGELLDIPLLLRLPGGRAGGLRINEPVSLLDVPPTLLELAGLLDQQPGQQFGRGASLAPMLARSPEPPRALMAELIQPAGTNTMIEQWPYRMIRMVGEAEPRLYRVDLDADELDDLAAKEPSVIERLSTLGAAIRPDDAPLATGEDVAREGELQRQLEALGYVEETP